MDELIKMLTKSDVLSEETIEKVKEHLALAESAAEKRAEKKLASKYKADMTRMMVAAEAMIAEGIKKSVTELAEDRNNLRRATAKASRAQALAEKRARASSKVALDLLEAALSKNLQKEISEFHADRKAQGRAHAKRLRESQAAAAADREAFAKRGAVVLETLVENLVRPHLKQLHEDIAEAKKVDFGRRLFEAFEADFLARHFKADKHLRGLTNKVAALTKELAESKKSATKELTEAREAARTAQKRAKRLAEQSERREKVGALLSNLTGDARKQMKTLLENAATQNLEKTYKQFLPEVLSAPGRVKLAPGAKPRLELREGNKSEGKASEGTDRDLMDLRRRITVV